MIIYFIGMSILLILGLASLVISKDDECNICVLPCVISALVFSLTSWVGIILILLRNIRRIWFE